MFSQQASCSGDNPVLALARAATSNNRTGSGIGSVQNVRANARERFVPQTQKVKGGNAHVAGPPSSSITITRRNDATMRNLRPNLEAMSMSGWAGDFSNFVAAHPQRTKLDRMERQKFEAVYQQSNQHQGLKQRESLLEWQKQFQVSSSASTLSNTEEDMRHFNLVFAQAQIHANEALHTSEKHEMVAQQAAEWGNEFANMDEEALIDQVDMDQLEKEFLDTWNRAAAGNDADKGEFIPTNQDWADSFINGPDTFSVVPDLPYHFEAENQYMTHPDPLAEGLSLLHSAEGSLTLAALAFEAALQRIETLGLSDTQVSEAWEALGRTQQENEKEGPALAALQRAIQINPGNQKALIAAAISYINEGHDQAAYKSLSTWIAHSYPELAEKFPNLRAFSNGQDHIRERNQLVDLYMSAARLGGHVRGVGQIDPDVQVGLGVLYYSNNDYAKAVDCFEAALSVRPTDHVLWNRLGATLANSGEPEAAIDAYSRALSLKPSFVRAQYNLGVGCMNIGCYKEAAEHFLGALNTHRRSGVGVPHVLSPQEKNISMTLWDTLRRAFYGMNRGDLAALAQPQTATSLDIFRKDFDF